MSVIIDEISAEIEGTRTREGGGEAETRPAENMQQPVMDLLELAAERKARLVAE